MNKFIRTHLKGLIKEIANEHPVYNYIKHKKMLESSSCILVNECALYMVNRTEDNHYRKYVLPAFQEWLDDYIICMTGQLLAILNDERLDIALHEGKAHQELAFPTVGELKASLATANDLCLSLPIVTSESLLGQHILNYAIMPIFRLGSMLDWGQIKEEWICLNDRKQKPKK